MKRAFVLFVLLLAGFPLLTFAPPSRPKITALQFVRLKATDLDKSDNFYGDILRLPRVKSGCFTPAARCYSIGPSQRVEVIAAGNVSSSSMDAVAFSTASPKDLRLFLLAQGLKPGKLSSSSKQKYFEMSDPEHHQLIFASVPSVAGPVSSAAVTSEHMIHTGFVVEDRAATDHFYKDVLAFRPYWHGGMKDDKDDWVAMQVPDGTEWVEYMLNISPNAGKHTLGVMNHIALGVNDIHETQKQLIANGWKPTEEPKIGRDGKWQLNLYDPDETRSEFMEFRPTEKPCCSDFTGPHPAPN